MTFHRRLKALFVIIFLSLLAACGGGGGGGGSGDGVGVGGGGGAVGGTPGVVAPKLVSIQVTPAAPTEAIGFSRQFTATGTFDSGPTQDVTTSASWASSTAEADIGINTGLAKAVAVGTPSITATLDSIASNAVTFTVTPVTQWTAAEPMADVRSSHTATTLPDGTVLMAGGEVVVDVSIPPTRTATSEIYNVTTGLFTPGGALDTGRSSHTATLLVNDTVLVVGGVDNGGSALSSSEIYTPVTNAWTAALPMNTPRTLHTATLLKDGRVLVTGGVTLGAPTDTAEIYDPAGNAGAGTWTATATPMSIGRESHTATLLASGKVLVIGGEGVAGKLASVEIYDPTANTWTSPSGALTSLTTARRAHLATELADGKILVTGGMDNSGGPGAPGAPITESELYDPTEGTFGPAAALATGRSSHSATLLPSSGRVLVTGGFNGAETSEVYDPATNLWVPTGVLANPRAAHTATLLSTGRILVTGGLVQGGPVVSFKASELY